MARYAIVDNAGKILNITEWDGSSAWAPPAGTQAVLNTVGADQTWTYVSGAFVPPVAPPAPPPTTEDVNAIRDARLAAGFTDSVTGKTIQCDDRSIGKLGAMGSAAGLAIVMAILPAPQFQIVTADNSILTLTPTQTFALLQGRVMPWVSGTWLYARTLKDQIIAGQTPDITAGWP